MSYDVSELTRKLIRLPSENPPGNEAAVSDFVYDIVKSLGLRVIKQRVEKDRYNIIATKKGRLPGIMLQGHLDTVPIGSQKWRRRQGQVVGGRIYGRGASDMKGAVAAMLTAIEIIMDEETRQTALVFTVGEESGFLGAKRIKQRPGLLRGIRLGINGEPTGMRLGIAQKGLLTSTIRTSGVEKHGSSGDMKNNAIVKMNTVMDRLVRYAERIKRRKHSLLGSPTLNLGRIEGGVKRNIVAGSAQLMIERRIVPPETVGLAKSELRRVVRPEGRIEFFQGVEPVFRPGSAELKPVTDACRRFGLPTTGIGLQGTTEIMVFNQMRIPTVVIGPGEGAQAHAVDEYVTIRNLKLAAKLYAECLRV